MIISITSFLVLTAVVLVAIAIGLAAAVIYLNAWCDPGFIKSTHWGKDSKSKI